MPADTSSLDPAALRLAAGRAKASEQMPYLSTALFALRPVRTEAVATAAVDRRWRLYWNPAFIAGLTVTECAGVWLHEVGHVLRDHNSRWQAMLEPPTRQPAWNVAADAVINADLREANVALPARPVYPEAIPGADRSMTAEQVYRLFAPGAPPPPTGAPDQPGDLERGDRAAAGEPRDCGSATGGNRRPWEHPDEDSDDGSVDAGRGTLIRQQVAHEIQQHARTRGAVPGGWSRWAQATLHPRVDWRRELNSTVRRAAAAIAGLRDYTYSRPARRASVVREVVLPTMRQPRPPRVCVVVDTSGSVSDAMLGQVLAEIGDIIARVSRHGGSGVEVISCDASAAQAQAIRALRTVTLTGGGGTDMRVGLAAAASRRPPADLIITMTDGYTPWPAEPPADNPTARYVAVLLDPAGATSVPAWMHRIVVDDQG